MIIIIIIITPLIILHIAIFMIIMVYDLAPRRRTVSAPAKAADRAEPTRRGELSGSTPKTNMIIKIINDDQGIQYTSSYKFMRRGEQSGSTL